MDEQQRRQLSKLVEQELRAINLRLSPQARYSEPEIEPLVGLMLVDLEEEGIATSSHILRAFRAHRRNSNWMPTSKDIICAHRDIVYHTPKPPECKALPVGRGLSPRMKAVFARKAELVAGGMEDFAAMAQAMREYQNPVPYQDCEQQDEPCQVQ